MRADRLIALLLFLQNRGQVTAAEVAAELEISLATARRDLEALSAAGVPVTVQPGRGGGWRLIGGARTNLTGLTGEETHALFWMLGTAGLSNPQIRLATRKLVQALPETLRAEADVLASSIHYDHAVWGEARAEQTEHLGELRRALVAGEPIEIDYRRSGTVRSIRLLPLGLVAKAGVWYLVAERGPRPSAGEEEPEVRTYRVDRIQAVAPAPNSPPQVRPRPSPPRGFDLVDYWTAHVEEIEAHRSAVSARVRAPNWTVPILRDHFGRHLTVISTENGQTLAELRANLVIALAEQLAGWGSTIEVLGPPELRAELARIGRELTARYGSAPESSDVPDVRRQQGANWARDA